MPNSEPPTLHCIRAVRSVLYCNFQGRQRRNIGSLVEVVKTILYLSSSVLYQD